MSKKSAKSVEELLKEALVPEEEQPYKVPDNWIWVKSEAIAKWGSGGTPSRNNLEYYQGNIPWIKTGELRDQVILEAEEYISEEAVKNSSAKLFPKGSIAIAMYGATIGKMGILGIDATTNQACAVGIPNDLTTTLFMYYFFRAQKEQFINLGKGGAQPNISQTIIKNYPFPLPPINEQKRIADKVERLLDKINHAKQLIEEAKVTFGLRRAAILDKAFRGELTKSWREVNVSEKSGDTYLKEIDQLKQGKYNNDCEMAFKLGEKNPRKIKIFNSSNVVSDIELPVNWTICSLGDIVCDFRYGTSLKSDYNNEGIPVLRIPNIGNSNILLDDLKYLTENDVDKSNKVSKGDILIIRSNGSKNLVGKCAIVDSSCNDYAFASYLIRIRTIGVLPEYVYFLLRSESTRKQFFKKAKSSAGINNINTEELSSTIIPLPPFEEQIEIVNRIKHLFNIEDEALKFIEIEKSIDSLSSAVLSRAFRGEL